MTFKEIFHLDNLFHKIKLDKSEIGSVDVRQETTDEQKDDDDFSGNEWNQEYELIYSSYTLDY